MGTNLTMGKDNQLGLPGARHYQASPLGHLITRCLFLRPAGLTSYHGQAASHLEPVFRDLTSCTWLAPVGRTHPDRPSADLGGADIPGYGHFIEVPFARRRRAQ